VICVTALLDDFLSRDASRIVHASWTVVDSRDLDELTPLIPAVKRIRAAVAPVDLGGVIRSNAGNFEAAMTKLGYLREGVCWCEDYTLHDQWRPAKEEERERIRILSHSEPGWDMTYEVECTICGRVFRVEQGAHHVEWWAWVPRGEKRNKTPKRKHGRGGA
jgi:hypothetical protein